MGLSHNFMKKRILVITAILGIAALGGIGYAGFRVYNFLSVPPNQDAIEQIILIEPGTSLRLIVEQLHTASVISDKTLFMMFVRFSRNQKSIKAGEYKFTTSMRPTDVLTMLQDGKIMVHPITIPEGYTAVQIAELLETAGIATREQFLALAFDKQVAAELQVKADTLEGYLFPSTYYTNRGTTAKEMLRKMAHQFWQVMSPELQAEIERKGFTVHEIVTLASIIEKEAHAPEEREIISAVYHNRLKLKMKLDSDPSVIYGIKDFDGNLTRADLQTDTPYNTYMNRGLPPGPIANPGEKSLLAAMRPTDVKYLFFVARNDGTHEFSVTYRDHLKAVSTYQKHRQNTNE